MLEHGGVSDKQAGDEGGLEVGEGVVGVVCRVRDLEPGVVERGCGWEGFDREMGAVGGDA